MAEGKYKVVIADDELMMRQVLKVIIEAEEGLELVGEASDGEEALQQCRRSNPDIVCLDIMMPKKDGLETLKTLREEFPHISVVMISANATSEKVKEALALGAKGFIVKPFNANLVLDRLRSLIARNVAA